jgi:hypothetical protein
LMLNSCKVTVTARVAGWGLGGAGVGNLPPEPGMQPPPEEQAARPKIHKHESTRTSFPPTLISLMVLTAATGFQLPLLLIFGEDNHHPPECQVKTWD